MTIAHLDLYAVNAPAAHIVSLQVLLVQEEGGPDKAVIHATTVNGDSISLDADKLARIIYDPHTNNPPE